MKVTVLISIGEKHEFEYSTEITAALLDKATYIPSFVSYIAHRFEKWLIVNKDVLKAEEKE